MKSFPGPSTGSSSSPLSGSMTPPLSAVSHQSSSVCWLPSVMSPAIRAKSKGRPLASLSAWAVRTLASKVCGARWPWGRKSCSKASKRIGDSSSISCGSAACQT